MVLSIPNTKKLNFKIIGGALYVRYPHYGVVVQLLFIQPKYQNNNIASALLGALKKFTSTILFATGNFIWFTDNENSEKLSFYHKLRFHPAYSTCYSFEHIWLSTIINAINNIDSSGFL